MKRGEIANYAYDRVQQTLHDAGGVVVRQKTQVSEMIADTLGVPYEKNNSFTVHLLPVGKTVKREPSDPEGWSPTGDELRALEPFLTADEESDCCTRFWYKCIGHNKIRPLKIHLAIDGEDGDVYIIDRPFRRGGTHCSPLEMWLGAVENEASNPVPIGRVRENFSPYWGKCCANSCLSTTYTDIERLTSSGELETRYIVRVNTDCCGRVNNCCALSCWRPDAVFDVLYPGGEVAAHMQMSYGREDLCTSLCRSSGYFNNFVLEFPKDSTVHDRALLLTAIFQIDYQLFERE